MEKLLYNFFNKTKGAVSVFLVLVLVPMVTACCLFVDASRINLAKSVVQSSGDLALNTVLSNFDNDLAEIYGFMASAQNDAEIVASAKEYFKKSMISQGLEEAYADRYSNAISNFLVGESDGDINDLLGIDTVGDVKISPVSGGNLANPEVIRQQIVEFMKYRGPIEGATELYNKFVEIKDKVNDSKQIAKLTEDADEYYEDEKDALSEMEEAYKDILDYNDINQKKVSGVPNLNSGITPAYLEEIKKSISDRDDNPIKKDYKKWHTAYVMDLCTYTKYNPNKRSFTKTSVKRLNQVTVPDYNISSSNLLKTKLSSLQASYSNFEKHSKTIYNLNKTLPYKQGETYDIQYWIQMQKQLESDNLLSNFLTYYYSGTTNSPNKNSISYLMAYIEKGASKLDSASLNEVASLPYNSSIYQQQSIADCIDHWHDDLVAPKYENSMDENKNPYNIYNIYNNITNKVSSICQQNQANLNNSITNINNGVNGHAEKITKYYNNLKAACGYLNSASGHLKKAKKHIEDMNESFETWKKDYEASNSRVKNEKEIKEQYEDAKKTIEELGLTPAKIEDFKTRIGNTSSLLGSVKAAIDGFKYKDTAIKDIKTFDDFAKASKVEYSKITTVKSELEKLAQDTFSMKYPKLNNCSVSSKNNPNFNSQPVHEVYSWLKNKYKDKDGNPTDPRKKDKNREKEEENSESWEDAEDSSTNKANTKGQNDKKGKNIKGKENLPSKGSSTDKGIKTKKKDTKNISNFASSIGDLFKDFDGAVASMRDDLYILLYISNMFTYDTFEKEKDYAKEKKGGKEDEFARCSLTNKPLNEKNNYAYLSEIEYIIYGNTNAENKVASYGTIYGIRYALDLMYAITNFWGNNNTTGIAINGIANAIAGATYGIIPAPLTKLILILGLTGVEATSDLDIIRGGYPLALFKDEDVWRCQINKKSFSFDGVGSKEEFVKKNEEKDLTFQYSEYLKLILFMKLLGNRNPILLRTADVVQVNMDMKHSGFLMKKCRVYYKLEATCRNPNMMLGLPIIQGSLKQSNIKFKKWNEYSVTVYRGY